MDCVVNFMRLATPLLKGEEFARHLEYVENQLLLIVVTLINSTCTIMKLVLTDFNMLTGAISDWLNIDHQQNQFPVTFVMADAYSQSFCGLCDTDTVNIFLSANEMVLHLYTVSQKKQNT